MNNQEVFNKNWDWFVVQKKPKSVVDLACSYRGKDGAKCGIGICIPDEVYNSWMEGRGIRILLQGFPEIKTFFEGCDEGFLREVQLCHDELREESFKDNIEMALRDLAVDWKLKIPE